MYYVLVLRLTQLIIFVSILNQYFNKYKFPFIFIYIYISLFAVMKCADFNCIFYVLY